MVEQRVRGILVLHEGRIRLERYASPASASTRWNSFSIAKSITSTLVGAALKDGAIHSLDDPVTRYIDGLRGSGPTGSLRVQSRPLGWITFRAADWSTF